MTRHILMTCCAVLVAAATAATCWAADNPAGEVQFAEPTIANQPFNDPLTDLARQMTGERPAELISPSPQSPAPTQPPAEASTPSQRIALHPAATPLFDSSEAPVTSPSDGTSSWVLKTAGALGVVIVLILVLRSTWSKMTGQVTASARHSVVEVLTRCTIAPRNHVLLLRLGGRVLVVSDSSGGLRTLANIDDPEEVAQILASVTADKPGSISRNFSQMLSRFNREHVDPEALDETTDSLDAGPDVDPACNQLSDLLSQVRKAGETRERQVVG